MQILKKATFPFLMIFGLAIGMAQTERDPMSSAALDNLPTQPIGVNDLVSISVYRSPELTRTVRVNPGGGLVLPLLTESVKAEGLLPKEVGVAIARALREGGLLVNPIVEVTVAEYASRPISVMGAVNKPLTFQAFGRITLLDALARAEGLSEVASREVLVSLPDVSSGSSSRLLRRISVKKLIDEADPKANLVLRGGEEIRVPPAGHVFVMGNVKRPGSYPVHPEDASVMKMIAIAEGLTPYHRKIGYIIREDPDTGAHEELEFELAAIMKRQAPDIPMEINDILYIPDHPSKRTRDNIIEKSFTFGAATVSGLLIWRR